MTHDPDEGLKFLRWLYPEGPWVMTAIDVDQQETPTRTFYPNTETQFREWLFRFGGHNIYYHVNRALRAVSKKMEREDIGEMAFLHVDVDPRRGENFDEERVRIDHLFTDRYPRTLPKPSAIIDSGGGYNALWRLRDPVPIAKDSPTELETKARYESAKRYNLQLEIELGGDNCHNVDRILRLPGTTNYPTTKKKSLGRKVTTASIVYLNDEIYSLALFSAAVPVQGRGVTQFQTTTNGITVQVSGNIKRLGHVEELGENVSQRCKMIIVQGFDPDDPNKFSGRSEWLFYVCCELVRSGVSDEMIYSVITDPGFMISASVLDKGAATERYVNRQIQRAREWAIDPMLANMNDKHAVIGNMGGQCRVVEEMIDHGLNRDHLAVQGFDDFRNRYMNQKVEIGKNPKSGEPVYKSLGQWWLEHKSRRQYEQLVFVPGRQIGDALNLWKGFACSAIPGDKHQPFLVHLQTNVCGNRQDLYDYLVKWMARAVQQPDTQGEVAVVFRGDEGIGKGTIAKVFGSLWGRHYIQISDPKHLVGSFNEHLRDAVVVFADEAFYAGDKKHESVLKTMITEDNLSIEGKFRAVQQSRNYIHLLMASNSMWVVPAGLNARRFCVIDVLNTMMRNAEYFSVLYKSIEGGGRENLLYFLMNLDLTGYDVRKIPMTEGLRDQKLFSMTNEQEWWYHKLVDGILAKQHGHWTEPIYCDDMLGDYLNYMQRLGVQRRATATSLGRFIHTVSPPGYPRKRQGTRKYDSEEGPGVGRAYSYEFPTLEECRKFWDQKFGGPYDWSKMEEISLELPKEHF